jgi:zinc/manganese transport system substrate-binding protein
MTTIRNPARPARAVRAVRAATAGVFMLVLAGLTAGCSSSPPTQATDSSTLIRVVAAEDVWGAVAAQIGGTQVRVTDILGAASAGSARADPQTYQPSAVETRAIAGAQVFIINGAGLDPWADEAASAHPGIGRLDVNIGAQVGVTPGQDPYLWYDPQYVTAAARQIEQDFAQLRPAGAAYFQQQEQAFEQNAAPASAALTALRRDYGGRTVGVCPGTAQSAATQFGLKPVQATAAAIAGKSVKVLLCDTTSGDPDDQVLLRAASAAAIPVVQLGDTLEPAGASFASWLTGQLDEIHQALAGT